jgi:hypothetical protein
VLPVVIIDVVPADVPAEHALRMVEACSEALPSGDCGLSANSPESTRPESVALVVWQSGEFLQVNVRVGRRDREWVTRQLSFSQDDSVPDRFTAVGLTVATLVDEIQPPKSGSEDDKSAPTKSAVPSTDAQTPIKQKSSPAASEPRPRWEFAVALGGLLAPGWTDGGVQKGAWLSAQVNWPGTIWFGSAYASYAVSDGPEVPVGGSQSEWQTNWFTGAVGVGARGVLRPVDLRLQIAAELGFRRVQGELGKQGETTDQQLRARLHGALVWPARGRFGVLAGGILGIPPVNSESDDAGETLKVQGPSFEGEILGGLEVRF